MGIRLFDNYEDDGQLSLFGLDGSEWDFEEMADEKKEEEGSPDTKKAADETSGRERPGKSPARMEQPRESLPESGPEIRIKSCGSCGKLLFVREEEGGYTAACNNCGISYFQKK